MLVPLTAAPETVSRPGRRAHAVHGPLISWALLADAPSTWPSVDALGAVSCRQRLSESDTNLRFTIQCSGCVAEKSV